MTYVHLRSTIEGGFWKGYQDLLRQEVLTYQWKALNDLIPGTPPGHSVESSKIAAGMTKGEYDGMVIQDSDLAKWREAAGLALADDREDNEELREWVNESIDLAVRAQQKDGYLNSYFTIKEPERRCLSLARYFVGDRRRSCRQDDVPLLDNGRYRVRDSGQGTGRRVRPYLEKCRRQTDVSHRGNWIHGTPRSNREGPRPGERQRLISI